MKEKNQVVPDEVLSKEFLSQFKTEADVSKFLKQLQTLSQKVCLISSKKGPTLACQP